MMRQESVFVHLASRDKPVKLCVARVSLGGRVKSGVKMDTAGPWCSVRETHTAAPVVLAGQDSTVVKLVVQGSMGLAAG